jgi:hypothetical protein
MWYLAQLYADQGYFAESAAVPNHANALRLYAEMQWWREHSWQISGIH